MEIRTREKLTELGSYPWFTSVGKPIEGDVIRITSWPSAIQLCTGEIWQSVRLQTSNRLAREISQRCYERYALWNSVVRELYPFIDEIINKKIAHLQRSLDLPLEFQDVVRWDILSICMEVEYQDAYGPILFTNRLQPWYKLGHFPCGWEGPMLREGWEGPLPEWKIAVF